MPSPDAAKSEEFSTPSEWSCYPHGSRVIQKDEPTFDCPEADRSGCTWERVKRTWLDDVDWSDPLDYIRKRYNVPAEKGRAVRLYNGDVGVIDGADNGHLLVKMPLDGQIVRVHPTWGIDYDAAFAHG